MIMNTKLKLLRIFLFFVTLKVMTVELCKQAQYNAKDLKSLERDGFVIDRSQKFYKCVPEKINPCSNCVPSGYKLKPVTYVEDGSNQVVNMFLYSVTGCKCAALKPINQINKGPESQEKHYLKMYKMMRNCTFTLAAVCIAFIVIIICLCVRYEPCCKKSKRRQKKQNNNSTVLSKPAETRVSLIQQEEEPVEA